MKSIKVAIILVCCLCFEVQANASLSHKKFPQNVAANLGIKKSPQKATMSQFDLAMEKLHANMAKNRQMLAEMNTQNKKRLEDHKAQRAAAAVEEKKNALLEVSPQKKSSPGALVRKSVAK